MSGLVAHPKASGLKDSKSLCEITVQRRRQEHVKTTALRAFKYVHTMCGEKDVFRKLCVGARETVAGLRSLC